MNALTILLALAVAACGVIGDLDQTPHLDTAATKAAQSGGCVQLRCEYFPVTCRAAAARCERW